MHILDIQSVTFEKNIFDTRSLSIQRPNTLQTYSKLPHCFFLRIITFDIVKQAFISLSYSIISYWVMCYHAPRLKANNKLLTPRLFVYENFNTSYKKYTFMCYIKRHFKISVSWVILSFGQT